MPERDLSEQLMIPGFEIEDRKRLLGITKEHLRILGTCGRSILPHLDDIIDAFYEGQLADPAIRRFIEDNTSLASLKAAMRGYIASLFGGDYTEAYVAARLRIGRAHARIGVQPMYYVASVHQLSELLKSHLSPREFNPQVTSALDKILLFDLVLVFETYIQGLINEVYAAKDDLAAHALGLERIVAERTAALKRIAQTDDLTGLRNRRALIAALADEILRIRNQKGAFAVAFLDVDKFKQINDRVGHLAGDRVLQKIAKAFAASVPNRDQVYRYGGDEFVAIFPVPEVTSTAEAAARLKSGIETRLDGTISVSVGCSFISHDNVPPLEDILVSIDREMYRHKAGGERSGATATDPVAGPDAGPAAVPGLPPKVVPTHDGSSARGAPPPHRNVLTQAPQS